MVCIYEIMHNNITTIREKLKQKNNLFNARKKRKTNKKITVKKNLCSLLKKYCN